MNAICEINRLSDCFRYNFIIIYLYYLVNYVIIIEDINLLTDWIQIRLILLKI